MNRPDTHAPDQLAHLNETQFRALIVDLVGQYARAHHAPRHYVPGEGAVPVSGRVYGDHEMQMLAESCLDFWLTAGRFNSEFEERLATLIGVKHALTVNSGSSANLVAFSALTSHYLGAAALKPGDEMITVATGFPTTVNPALQYGVVPVFVDVDIPTYNIKPELIEAAVTDKTRAIMLAHTLGELLDAGTKLTGVTVGRTDLTASYGGHSVDSCETIAMVKRVAKAAKRRGLEATIGGSVGAATRTRLEEDTELRGLIAAVETRKCVMRVDSFLEDGALVDAFEIEKALLEMQNSYHDMFLSAGTDRVDQIMSRL